MKSSLNLISRNLRYRRRRHTQARRDVCVAEAAAGGGAADSGIWRSALRPGSPLMLEIKSSICYYVCRALAHGTGFGQLHFEITGSTVPVRSCCDARRRDGP